MSNRWQGLKEAFLDFLFPPHCVNCGREGDWLCPACQNQLSFILPPLCPKCGRHLGNALHCTACQSLRIDGIRSVAYSEGILREAIHQFKYNGIQVLALPFGRMLYACWRSENIPADVLVPVPLHPQRIRQRGYNQSLLLAEQLSRYTGLPVDQTTLQRVKNTLPQVDLDARQRRENVTDAFQCTSASLAGKDIVLIDDVCTTGATLEACSDALKAQGARSVWGFTLGRARDAA
ncbi:MAG: ComF family protein [Chloroflexi bacterium]|nr:ComF family protein [Chloroflexota bacterium]